MHLINVGAQTKSEQIKYMHLLFWAFCERRHVRIRIIYYTIYCVHRHLS